METTASMSEAEDIGEAMEIAAPIAPISPISEPAAPATTDKHVCPYCGLAGPRPEGPCARCTIEDSPQTRQATKSRIGPWYVLQNRNPAAPGMKWSTLLALVKKGQVTQRAVVRGPTTHQLWRLGSQVKGLSREFNLCYSCGGQIEKTANQCPHCDRLQEPPANPDVLLESREPVRRTVAEIEAAGSNTGSVSNGNGAPALSLAIPRRDAEKPAAPLAKTEVGILSAKELAAAFQLDFNEDTVADPAAVAKSVTAKSAPVKQRRSAFGRVLLVLVLLSLVGVGAVVWMTPPYQARAREMIGAGWLTVKNQVAAIGNSFSSSSSSGETTLSSATPAIEPPAVKPVEAKPLQKSQVVDRKPDVLPQSPHSSQAPIPAITFPSDPEEIRQLVRSVRSAAIDAEAAGDFRKAIQHYEQIRRAPREYWPSDLDLRLSSAKEKVR